MRDWIGTGISLLGSALVVVAAVVAVMRAKGRRSPGGRPSVPGRAGDRSAPGRVEVVQDRRPAAHPLLWLCGGLMVVEAGQLIRAPGRLWAVLHLAVIGVVAAGALLIYRGLRNARRRP